MRLKGVLIILAAAGGLCAALVAGLARDRKEAIKYYRIYAFWAPGCEARFRDEMTEKETEADAYFTRVHFKNGRVVKAEEICGRSIKSEWNVWWTLHFAYDKQERVEWTEERYRRILHRDLVIRRATVRRYDPGGRGTRVVLDMAVVKPGGVGVKRWRQFAAYSYDEKGHLVEYKLFDAQGNLLGVYKMAYDRGGKVDSVTEYDPQGNVVRVQDTAWSGDLHIGLPLNQVLW